MDPVRYRILGTTQALRPDGTPVPVGGARLRALLTVLALRPGRTVSAAVLVDEVWDGDLPADAPGALQALVGRLRRAIGPDAVESVDGEVVTGANMENACYRLGLCAEQSALTAAQHAFGLDKVARIAVVGGTGAIVCTPCGGCRQAILEAAQLSGRDIEILCSNGDGTKVERFTIGALIPHGFGPANLSD